MYLLPTIKMGKESEWIKIISVWQLMKSLMDKKWIPRWYKEIVRAVYDRRHKMIWLYEDNWKEYFELVSKKSLRELVSIDSWLWQFVCENGMIKKPDIDRWEIHNWDNPRHWIVESALCDEDKLEDFLLTNINIEWN